jgi:hypothetical protein
MKGDDPQRLGPYAEAEIASVSSELPRPGGPSFLSAP